MAVALKRKRNGDLALHFSKKSAGWFTLILFFAGLIWQAGGHWASVSEAMTKTAKQMEKLDETTVKREEFRILNDRLDRIEGKVDILLMEKRDVR